MKIRRDVVERVVAEARGDALVDHSLERGLSWRHVLALQALQAKDVAFCEAHMSAWRDLVRLEVLDHL